MGIKSNKQLRKEDTANNLTIKVSADVTEVKKELNEIEKQLDRIIDKISFVQDLDKVKNIVEKVK